MLSQKIKTTEYQECGINYNSDYSGLVRVYWRDGKEFNERWIPGAILLAIVNEVQREELKSKVIEFIEQL